MPTFFLIRLVFNRGNISEGRGLQTNHIEILAKEDKYKLWSSGVMGVTIPRLLENAAFIVVGKSVQSAGWYVSNIKNVNAISSIVDDCLKHP